MQNISVEGSYTITEKNRPKGKQTFINVTQVLGGRSNMCVLMSLQVNQMAHQRVELGSDLLLIKEYST